MKVSGLAIVVIVVSGVAVGLLIAWSIDSSAGPDPVPSAVIRDNSAAAEAPSAGALAPRAQVDVVVVDGTGNSVDHLRELERLGYDQLIAAPTAQPVEASAVLYAPGHGPAAERLVDDLDWSDVVAEPLDPASADRDATADADVVVRIGSDHD